MKKTLGAERFWAVAAEFRGTRSHWAPVSAGYELRSAVDVEGKRWTACFKIHVVPGRGAGTGGVSLGFKSSVTFWPPDLSREEEKRLLRLGWYDANEEVLVRAGYRGKWSKSPSGRWGDFWKDLRGVADVRREVKRLEKLQLALAGESRMGIDG